jgi:glycosyltransferase involved in cell wall biosynthesis
VTVRSRTRILELRSIRGTGGGPDKTILLGARPADTRFAVTVCYIRDARDEVFGIDAKARALGVDYVEVLERHSFDRSVVGALRRLIHDRGVDIVHAHDYKTDLLAWWLGRDGGVIPMATAHGWSGHSWRERYVYYPADRRVLARLPHVVAVSEEIRQALIAAGAAAERISTIANGVDAETFRRDRARDLDARARIGAGAGDVVVGAVGRLGPEKRFDLLIDAFARLAADDARLQLVIVGGGPLQGRLNAQAEQLGLGSRVRLLGHRADVVDLYHAFDVFALCSDHEGSPNALLEAMAMEVPIVSTAVGAVPEMARDREHAVLVPAGSVEALANGIAAVLADAPAAQQRAAAARQRVERDLSFAARNAKIDAIYGQLADRRPTAARRAS